MVEAGQYLQMGRYRIVERLNQGGMGTVYLATDRNLAERWVALKENSDTSPQTQEQFQREAVILARLTHPNLPRVTDHFIEANGRQYLVMDYIGGDDLRQVVQKRGGPLPEAEALAIIEEVMAALAYMHSWIDSDTGLPSPIIHRDIKPSNIKLAADGRVVLVDFGLAKYQTGPETQLGARAFTAGYSPVEQYTGGTDVRSDIYSLGATLYLLVTGERPPDALARASGTPLPAPRQSNPSLSRNTERVILRALQLHPAERFQTVQEMYAALHSPTTTFFSRERRTTPFPQGRLRQGDRSPTRPRHGLLLLMGLLTTVVSLLLILWQRGNLASMIQFGERAPSGATMRPENTSATPAAETFTPTPPPSKTVTATVIRISVGVSQTTVIAAPTQTAQPTENPPTGTATPTITPIAHTASTAERNVQNAAPTLIPFATATATSPPPTATTTQTPLPTPTATTAPTATQAPLPTNSPAPTSTPTVPSPTSVPSPSVTPTRTQPPTATPPPTATNSPTHTPLPTASPTLPPRPSATATASPNPSATATETARPTTPPTQTPTRVPSHTPTPPPPQAGDRRINPVDNATYVYVPAGPFTMGSTFDPDEMPVHAVELDAFWILQTEVTNAQYAACVEAGACTPPNNERWRDPAYADHPVVNIDWHQADDYAAWAGGRLPTEAEWEKAARGADERLYPWAGSDIDDQKLNYNAKLGDTVAVGQYPDGASPFGLLDMAGNVEEWVADWHAPGYDAAAPRQNPTGPSSGVQRVVRGGSFTSNRAGVRTTARGKALPDGDFPGVGLRVVLPKL